MERQVQLVSEGKMKRFLERKDKSLCVRMKKRMEVDKILMEEAVKGIHPEGIDKVFFPRQSKPRFFFVLCKDENVKTKVGEAIKAYKGEELGPLVPKPVRERKMQVKRPPDLRVTKDVDPLTLVLEAIPKELETEAIQKEFSKSERVHRFNDRRCYLYFKDAVDACEALKRLKTEPINGYKISARFDKVKQSGGGKEDKMQGIVSKESELKPGKKNQKTSLKVSMKMKLKKTTK